jgi:hypothetical protein
VLEDDWIAMKRKKQFSIWRLRFGQLEISLFNSLSRPSKWEGLSPIVSIENSSRQFLY